MTRSNRNYKSIICLNGDLPEKEFFDNNKFFIIAADGGFNKLYDIGIKPNLVIGDLDGVSCDLSGINVIHINEQDNNDFEKALDYASKKYLLPSLIVGVDGGYIDQIFNNLSIINKYDCDFLTPNCKGYIINKGSTLDLELKINSKISIFGAPSALANSQGLKWELNNYELNFAGENSCSNRSAKDFCKIEIVEGKAMIIIYNNLINDAGSIA